MLVVSGLSLCDWFFYVGRLGKWEGWNVLTLFLQVKKRHQQIAAFKGFGLSFFYKFLSLLLPTAFLLSFEMIKIMQVFEMEFDLLSISHNLYLFCFYIHKRSIRLSDLKLKTLIWVFFWFKIFLDERVLL